MNAPRRADAPVADAKMLRAAFRFAFRACPQATHLKSTCEHRGSVSTSPHALQVREMYAAGTLTSSQRLAREHLLHRRPAGARNLAVSSPPWRARWCRALLPCPWQTGSCPGCFRFSIATVPALSSGLRELRCCHASRALARRRAARVTFRRAHSRRFEPFLLRHSARLCRRSFASSRDKSCVR